MSHVGNNPSDMMYRLNRSLSHGQLQGMSDKIGTCVVNVSVYE